MTLLIASICPRDKPSLRDRADEAWSGGAEAVEVRIDRFEGQLADLAGYLRAHRDRIWIVTCRSRTEGGYCCDEPLRRAAQIAAAVEGTTAYVDFEFAGWQQSSDVREKIRRAMSEPGTATATGVETATQAEAACEAEAVTGSAAGAAPDDAGSRLILSSHCVEGRPASIEAVADELLDVDQIAAAKVAYRANHVCESFGALDLAGKHRGRLTAIAMGEEGLWSRVLAKKLGAFATYCTLDPASATAPGQVTLEDMVQLYRWSTIDESTRVFGVIGDPVAHSLSPRLFNQWFADAGMNAVYLPLRVGTKESGLQRFLDGCVERSWLDLGGLSVTLPHKSAALAWIGTGAHFMASEIGALNTLVFRDGEVRGFNTDCYAAFHSLVAALGCDWKDLRDVTVDVLGSGGAARAVLRGLREHGCEVTVYSRSFERTKETAGAFAARPASWKDRARRTGEVLINCTSVGMWPEVDESPMPADALGGCRLVFDLIYNPLETQLLADARRAGAVTLNGLDMFVRQATMQFELWTGEVPDMQRGRELLIRGLRTDDRPELSNTEVERHAPVIPDSGFVEPLSDCQGGSKSERSARAKVRSPLEHNRERSSPDNTDRAKPSIALIGMRGCGKTTVGRRLASLLGGDCLDTDELVVKLARKSISAIFAEEGEAGFRRREQDSIGDAVARKPAVISVGGGAILHEGSVDLLKTVATIVWLTAPAAVLSSRIATDAKSAESRPPLTEHAGQDEVRGEVRDEVRVDVRGEGEREGRGEGRDEVEHEGQHEIQRILARRIPHYARVADIVIDTTDVAPEDVARGIMQRLRSPRED